MRRGELLSLTVKDIDLERRCAKLHNTKISERRASQLVGLSRTVLHYESKAQPANRQLQARLIELAGERQRFGYRRVHALVRREGILANHKCIYRLCREAGLPAV